MFKDIQDFYPTPKSIIDKMLLGIDFKMINSVLEPSAGKGDLVDAIIDKFKYVNYSYNRRENWDIDTIEINDNLQHILRGKEFRVVHNDYLTYSSFKKYDLIVMNPPFSTGDKHLLKALDMQESRGGQIVCLLNAETLRNPYNNIRKDLVSKLEKYNTEIEYIPNAFIDAEHKTAVEIALIKINISKPDDDSSIILDQLKKEEQFREQATYNSENTIVDSDYIRGIIERYNFEVRAGLKLIAEYEALKPIMLNSFNSEYKKPILKLELEDKDSNATLENAYIKQIRMKYWKALFMSDQFMGLFTSNLRDKYYNKVGELKDYDFSLYNIYTIKIQLNKEMIQAAEDTILNLFEELSHKYHWFDETSKNIHYYNGWKTNKSYKINKKVIILLNAYNSWNGGYRPTDYRIVEKLADIEKVLNYLDQGLTEEYSMGNALHFSEKYQKTKKVQTKYFMLTFYKKGTCHIEFTNEELLHKFNLYGSQRKGWLPPSYGKVKYKDMGFEEKQVVNEFEGEASYNNVMSNQDYYIVETSKLLRLA